MVIFSRTFTQFHAILAISAIFWPISTCWVLKCMYLSWEIQWWYFHALSRTPSHNFHAISCNFDYFGHFRANFNMFGIKKHVFKLRNSLVILYSISHISWRIPHELSQNFTQFHAIFLQIGLFKLFLGKIKHMWYQKVCTWAEKFIWGYFHQISHKS